MEFTNVGKGYNQGHLTGRALGEGMADLKPVNVRGVWVALQFHAFMAFKGLYSLQLFPFPMDNVHGTLSL